MFCPVYYHPQNQVHNNTVMSITQGISCISYSAYLSLKLPSSWYPLSKKSSSSSKLPIDPIDLSTLAKFRMVFGVKIGVFVCACCPSVQLSSISCMILSASSVV
eukprot:GFUD01055468.1.p1 GENE.GFUD01055468.1~~GFUD01055468.1.p1  ORF type:complete len:104 (+),score=8.65 GFUD01055468.1:2-313(+)